MKHRSALRALLVEDDAGVAPVIRNGFKKQGIELEWVRAGIQAVRSLRTGYYDAMLLEPMPPDIDGLDWRRDQRSGSM